MTNFEVTTGNPGITIVELQTGEGETHFRITTGTGSTIYEVSDGMRGPAGVAGPVGEVGPVGPAGPPSEIARRIEIYAKAAVAIPAGAAVYISGASGKNKIITLAQANTDSTSSKTLGLCLQALEKNQFGYVITEGDLPGLSINLGHGHGVEEGDPIWLSPTTPGGLVFGTDNKPSAPAHLVFLGIVTQINGNTLSDVFVKVQNGFELEELHNVAISEPKNNQVLTYDEGTQLWKNGFKAEYISNPDTGRTLVLRDGESRIYAYQLRLTEGTFQYGQINPPAFQPGDSSFNCTMPRASGTIALNTTALMLSGVQTAFGNKTFQGQIELTNQAITTGKSALNADLGDARYGATTAISAGPITSTTTNFATIVEITLGVGLYQIDAFIASLHNSAYGCKIRFGTSADIKTGITDNYGRPSFAAFSWPIIDDAYNSNAAYSVRSDSGAVEYRRTITGIVEILTPATKLRLEYAQLNESTAFPSTARARAHILARKIN
jgi:hypothetical protein